MPKLFLRPLLTLALVLMPCLLSTAPAAAESYPRFVKTQDMAAPFHLVHLSNGNLVVSGANSNVRVFSPSGTLLSSWGTLGPHPGMLNGISDIAITPAGDVCISSNKIDAVQKFSPGGTYMGTLVTKGYDPPGIDPDQVLSPGDIAIGPNGDLAVADNGTDRVLRFSSAGVFLGDFPVQSYPWDDIGLAIDPSGRYYVHGPSTIHRYSATGVLETSFTPMLPSGSWMSVKAITFDLDGNLLVVNPSDRLAKLTPDGALIWDRRIPGRSQEYSEPVDVSVGPDGTIVVSGRIPETLYYFRPSSSPDPLWSFQGAGENLVLHVDAVRPNPCGIDLADCSQAQAAGYTVAGSSGPYHYAYVLIGRAVETPLAGVQFGISYQNGNVAGMTDGVQLDIFSWQSCADLQFPESSPNAWPSPNTGNVLTWATSTHCQIDRTVIAGYFYVGAYSADQLSLTPRPGDGEAKVASCSSVEQVLGPGNLGSALFTAAGNAAGYNPCLGPTSGVPQTGEPKAIAPSSWSRIKLLGR